ncbi:MAG: hypothetical protein J6Z22_08970 [Lachnospiraceae bacterium]|nr:hypothetical protein [Lachnospiraceae bacterium]
MLLPRVQKNNKNSGRTREASKVLEALIPFKKEGNGDVPVAEVCLWSIRMGCGPRLSPEDSWIRFIGVAFFIFPLLFFGCNLHKENTAVSLLSPIVMP